MGTYTLCHVCGQPIYHEDADHYQDDAYEIEQGEIVCSDCIMDYVKQHYFKELREDA